MERDFTYIDDIVEGIYAALNCVKGCNLYNLGNNRPVKLERFVEILEEAIGKKAVRRYLPMQAGDVVTTYADIDLSSRELGFSPKTSLEEGLPLFVDWYKRYHNKG
jgi:UDP-glucuronate 4-epimerase